MSVTYMLLLIRVAAFYLACNLFFELDMYLMTCWATSVIKNFVRFRALEQNRLQEHLSVLQ